MNEVKIKYDPTNSFPGVPTSRFDDAAGLLLDWGKVALGVGLPIKEFMQECYGFGALHQFWGGTVDEDYTYNYPEDPPLPPLIVMDNGEAKIVIYKHAMVLFEETSGEQFMTRMD